MKLNSFLPKRSSASAAALLFALPVCAMAGSAMAAEHNLGLSFDNSFSVTLSGRLASDCNLSGGKTFDLGELQGSEVASAPFKLDCNVPFDVIVRASNGALAHERMPQGQGPFKGRLGYDLELSIPVLSPQYSLLQARYDSATLVGSRTLSSGDSISSGGGQIQVTTHPITGDGLLAGMYSESITLTISPRF